MTFGAPTLSTTVTATGDNNIDALLIGTKWASTSVSFSFTDNFTNDYESNYPLANFQTGFQSLNATQRAVARAWIGQGGAFYNVSNLTPYELTGASDRDATIRIALTANSNLPSARVADFPGNFVSSNDFDNGDVWFNSTDYNAPVIGNSAYRAFGHELGHALGLKHGHDSGYGVLGVNTPALSPDRDSHEFSIMTYRSYVGHPGTGGYTNETWGHPQSLMMYDIAALQHMYGAGFGYNSGNTTYTFSTTTGEMFVNGVGQGTPGANRIFRTIWDGNGIDTYDFSNYTTNLSIDLTPGGWSDLDVGGNFQRAILGDGHYARGQVFNALQYKGDVRSLIENANGGSGNDKIFGNSTNNVLNGNNGNDTVYAGEGNDTAYGGNGNDFLGGWSGNDYLSGGAGNDSLYADSGIDTLDGGAGDDLLFGHTDNQGVIDTLGPDNNPDYIYGGDGNDTLVGGFGNDNITGGSGVDILWGNQGADKFIFNYLSEGIDIIKDFERTEDDKIYVSGSGFGASSLSQFSSNSLTGALFFDPSGATGPTQFATIENKPAGFSTYLDIVIV